MRWTPEDEPARGRPHAAGRRGRRPPVGRRGGGSGGGAPHGARPPRRHVRRGQRARPVPVHLRARRGGRPLRAGRGRRQQGGRRLADAAPEAPRGDLRRTADPPPRAVRARRRQLLPRAAGAGARRGRGRARPRRRGRGLLVHPTAGPPDGVGFVGRSGRGGGRTVRAAGRRVRCARRLRRVRPPRRDGRGRGVGDGRRTGRPGPASTAGTPTAGTGGGSRRRRWMPRSSSRRSATADTPAPPNRSRWRP